SSQDGEPSERAQAPTKEWAGGRMSCAAFIGGFGLSLAVRPTTAQGDPHSEVVQLDLGNRQTRLGLGGDHHIRSKVVPNLPKPLEASFGQAFDEDRDSFVGLESGFAP